MRTSFLPAARIALIALALAAGSVAAANPAARAADAPELPNPLRRLRAGQWALYRVNTLFGAAEQKQTVTAVSGEGDGRIVTIKTEIRLDDEVVDEREEASTYGKLLSDQTAALDDAENPSAEHCETEAGGATVAATAVRYTQDGKQYTLFLSEEIPLSGVIRLVEEGTEEPVVELIDFGE